MVKQGYDYDENGEFVRLWLPQLANVTNQYVHCPFKLNLTEQKRVNCIIGKDYVEPTVRAKFDWNPNGNKKVNKFAAKAKKF